MHRLLSLFRNLLHRDRVERELDDELQATLDLLIDEKVAAGMDPRAARRAARLELDGIESVKEKVRSARTGALLERAAQDFRYALHNLRHNPRFAATAICALAVGIGASTVMFSVFYNIFFNSIAAKDANRLVVPIIHAPGEWAGVTKQAETLSCNLADLDVIRRDNDVFEQVVGYASGGSVLLSNQAETLQLFSGLVTDDAFQFYGVAPLLGRGIVPGDGKPDAPPIFVMSYRTWAAEFHGDPHLVGQSFMINGEPRTLVGIMPPQFEAYSRAGVLNQVWLPFSSGSGSTGPHYAAVQLLARIRRGVEIKTAAAELDVIIRRLAQQHPDDFPKRFTTGLQSLTDYRLSSSSGAIFRADLKRMLWALLAAALMVLIIACTNVAILLLSRASIREREMAVRSALGASRSRIALQLLVEAAVLALFACLLGCGIAWFGVRAANTALHQPALADLSAELAIGLNLHVLLFAAASATITTLICGVAPAAYVWRTNPQKYLSGSGKNRSADSSRGRKVRSLLVVGEVALSLVLLVSAGLFTRSLYRLTHVPLGLDPDNLLLMVFGPVRGHDYVPDRARMATAAWQAQLQSMMDRIGKLPGVDSVAIDNTIPGYGPTTGPQVSALGNTRSEESGINECDENCLNTLRFHLLRGRWFTRDEVQGRQLVTVLTQKLSRDLFGEDDPVGKQLLVKDWLHEGSAPKRDAYFRIIGVVGDVKNGGLQQPPMPMAFTPPLLSGGVVVLVRTKVDPTSMMHVIQEQVWSVDPNEIFWVYRPLAQYFQEFTYAAPGMSVRLFAPLAGTALMLVIVGLFSVTAYEVSLRTYEFGIRSALGAQRHHILGTVLGRSLRVVAVGVLLGIGASYVTGRFIANQLWGVSPADPAVFVAVTLMIIAVALAASMIPAINATMIDPTIALRTGEET